MGPLLLLLANQKTEMSIHVFSFTSKRSIVSFNSGDNELFSAKDRKISHKLELLTRKF